MLESSTGGGTRATQMPVLCLDGSARIESSQTTCGAAAASLAGMVPLYQHGDRESDPALWCAQESSTPR